MAEEELILEEETVSSGEAGARRVLTFSAKKYRTAVDDLVWLDGIRVPTKGGKTKLVPIQKNLERMIHKLRLQVEEIIKKHG